MRYLLCICCLLTFGLAATGQESGQATPRSKEILAKYFQQETDVIAEQTFSEIDSLEDWESKKQVYRRQLLEMLGMDPMPPKTPLQSVVTGTLENDGVIVERLHFQSMPGVYVTANFYRPADQDGPLPAILYVCGHGGERWQGKSLGNKTHYQHHGAWFARNGFVCLTIDTVQLGEIEGIHHGTYREKMWWWNNRGYSSAGIEAFHCIRSLDYLQSRSEVDGDRIGVTGRSGGGAYSWWIAAIDDRVKVAVPVAGIASMKNHVVDGCVEGHCDCMYMVNTYRWDFPMVAALVAPRPLLISNTDKDRIFPLDGVVDVYNKAKQVYSLYDAEDHLGLHITEGPHRDTQELRIHAFRWMNRFLRDDESLVEDAAKPLFEKQDLRVFDELPDDERVTTIHESFVPKVSSSETPVSQWSGEKLATVVNQLKEKCFRGWPEKPDPLDVERILNGAVIHFGRRTAVTGSVIEYTSQDPFRLQLFEVQVANDAGRTDGPIRVHVLDQAGWEEMAPALAVFYPQRLRHLKADAKRAAMYAQGVGSGTEIFLVPRGVGPTAWTNDEREQTHIRRRFMLLGQTLAGMQVYDVLRGLEAIASCSDLTKSNMTLVAEGDAACLSAYAMLLADSDLAAKIAAVDLTDLPKTNRDAPDILNVSRVIELSDVVEMARLRIK